MNIQEAKRLSIIKWESIVANKGCIDFATYHKNIEIVQMNRKYDEDCGMCVYDDFILASGRGSDNCTNCPLYHIDYKCGNMKSAYATWSKNQTIENAQKILDLIKSIKEEDYDQKEGQEKEEESQKG